MVSESQNVDTTTRVELVKISGGKITSPICLVNSNHRSNKVVYGGEVYYPHNFVTEGYEMESGGNLPSPTITLSNTSPDNTLSETIPSIPFNGSDFLSVSSLTGPIRPDNTSLQVAWITGEDHDGKYIVLSGTNIVMSRKCIALTPNKTYRVKVKYKPTKEVSMNFPYNIQVVVFDSAYNYLGYSIYTLSSSTIGTHLKTIEADFSASQIKATYPNACYIRPTTGIGNDNDLASINLYELRIDSIGLKRTSQISEFSLNNEIGFTTGTSDFSSSYIPGQYSLTTDAEGTYATRYYLPDRGWLATRERYRISPGGVYTVNAEVRRTSATMYSYSTVSVWDEFGNYLGFLDKFWQSNTGQIVDTFSTTWKEVWANYNYSEIISTYPSAYYINANISASSDVNATLSGSYQIRYLGLFDNTPSLVLPRMSDMISMYSDLLGATVSRIIVMASSINDNGVVTGSEIVSRDEYTINIKKKENQSVISFEMSSPMEQNAIQLPRGLVINRCRAVYRKWNGTSFDTFPGDLACPYTGSSYYDATNTATTQANDSCNHSVSGCKIRFGNSPLPYMGIPSASKSVV